MSYHQNTPAATREEDSSGGAAAEPIAPNVTDAQAARTAAALPVAPPPEQAPAHAAQASVGTPAARGFIATATSDDPAGEMIEIGAPTPPLWSASNNLNALLQGLL